MNGFSSFSGFSSMHVPRSTPGMRRAHPILDGPALPSLSAASAGQLDATM
jgi:hypothetical protein